MDNYKDYIRKTIYKASFIDVHTHVGFSIGQYVKGQGGFCQSLEELKLKMQLSGVDISIVFPFAALYGNSIHNIKLNNGGTFEKEEFEFQLANQNIINEIINKHYTMFIPFMMVNPIRDVEKIIEFYNKNKNYVFGFKIHTKSSELSPSDITNQDFIELCSTNRLPLLFHTRACEDKYNYKSVLVFAERNPNINVCVAHAAGFDEAFFKEINDRKNVYFDVSPLFSLCHYAAIGNKKVISENAYNLDYRNPVEVLKFLYSLSPKRILWATDEPCGINNSNTYNIQVSYIKQFNETYISQIKNNTINFMQL